mmetsp:Transcript_26783/g.41488  ORF Transcript_26783/g.41488 Transcript_26783/m.41488 type:complete len:85 (+) Transcript_26783:190-444(+)
MMALEISDTCDLGGGRRVCKRKEAMHTPKGKPLGGITHHFAIARAAASSLFSFRHYRLPVQHVFQFILAIIETWSRSQLRREQD